MSELLKKFLEKAKEEAIFKFKKREPAIGEAGIGTDGDAIYFVKRTSLNYYQSGNLTIPAECLKSVITLMQIRGGDEL